VELLARFKEKTRGDALVIELAAFSLSRQLIMLTCLLVVFIGVNAVSGVVYSVKSVNQHMLCIEDEASP